MDMALMNLMVIRYLGNWMGCERYGLVYGRFDEDGRTWEENQGNLNNGKAEGEDCLDSHGLTWLLPHQILPQEIRPEALIL